MMKRRIAFILSGVCVMALLSSCGNTADQDELERLRAENESLKAQAEETTVISTETETTTTIETTVTSAETTTTIVTEPEYIEHEYGKKDYPSKGEVICRMIVDKDATKEELLDLFDGEINNTANDKMTVWFYSDKSMTNGDFDVAEIVRDGKYAKPQITMVDKAKGDELRNAAEEDLIIVTDAPPEWSYYDNCAVSFSGATIVSDYKGNDAIAVEIKFKNDSDKAQSYIFTFVTKAFQNGIECDNAFLSGSYDDAFDSGTAVKEIKPGAETTVYQIFKLYDNSSDVTVEISGLYDIHSEVIDSQTWRLS